MKRVVLILVACLAVLILGALTIPFLIDANQFRPRLEAEATKALGREVKLGDLQVSLLAGGVSANDLSIAEDPTFGRSAFLKAAALKIQVEMQPLIFSRRLIVTGVEIDAPEIELIESEKGVWNFASIGNRSQAKETAPADGASVPELTVKLIKITNGRISLHLPGDPQQTLEKLNLEVKDFSVGAAFPFTLSASIRGGGALNVDGKVGPLNAADASATPFGASLKVNGLNLAKAGFVRPSSGVDGTVSLNGSAASTGTNVSFRGTIQAQQLKLARNGKPAAKPVGLDFAVNYQMKARSGSLQRGEISIGAAKAQITGNYRAEGSEILVNWKLAAPNMPVDELTAILPALDIVLPRGSSLQGGTASANVTVDGSTAKPVTNGILALQKTRLAGFDLGSRMNTVAKLTGIKAGPDTDFDNISAHVRADAAGMKVEGISVIAPVIGELSGAGTISPSNDLDFKMTGKLLHTGGVLTALNPSGQTTVPFSIQGTAAEPKFVPDVKGIVGAVANDKLKTMTPADVGKAATGIIDLFKRKKQTQ